MKYGKNATVKIRQKNKTKAKDIHRRFCEFVLFCLKGMSGGRHESRHVL